MGQAKLRGTFEQRKAQAVASGRVKGKQTERPVMRERIAVGSGGKHLTAPQNKAIIASTLAAVLAATGE